jgi:hypothetical protein
MDAARAAIRHPWRGAALAASMPLGPRSETCVQPARKSRFAVFGLFAFEDQGPMQVKSRSEADLRQICGKPKAFRLMPVSLTACVAFGGTGFSREVSAFLRGVGFRVCARL